MGALGIVTACAQGAETYQFIFDPAKTFTDGTVRLQFFSHGTFSGTFAPLSNPLGTQTKLGSGSFGLLENDDIPALPYLELGHAALVRTSGSFQLVFDKGTMTASLSSYNVDRLPDNPMKLNATIALNNAMFQTQKPSGTFKDHLSPLNFGVVTVNGFKVRQQPGSRTATVVPLGINDFAIVATFMAEYELNVEEFGQHFPLTFQAPSSLVGFLHTAGSTATFGYPKGQGGENLSRDVSMALQPLPFFVFNASNIPASLMLTATVHKIGIQINGVRQMSAHSP